MSKTIAVCYCVYYTLRLCARVLEQLSKGVTNQPTTTTLLRSHSIQQRAHCTLCMALKLPISHSPSILIDFITFDTFRPNLSITSRTNDMKSWRIIAFYVDEKVYGKEFIASHTYCALEASILENESSAFQNIYWTQIFVDSFLKARRKEIF